MLPGLAHAMPPIGIELASGASLDVAPRTVVTVALRVTNHSGAAGEFEAGVALPQGWRLITPAQSFTLARGASVVRMVSLFVPESAAAGEHAFVYTVASRKQPALLGSCSVPVRVASAVKLQLTLLDMPELVIAGEPYTGTFVLRNSGNAPVTVDYKAYSSRGYRVDLPAGELTLEPGASSALKIRVATESVQALERDWLVVVAQGAGGDTSERATGVIKVVPRVTGTERRYNTIPATVGVRVAAQDKDGKRTLGTQAELLGGGKLGDSAERSLHFVLRGPNTTGQSVFGQPDEYRVDYTDRGLAVSLGDLSYGLSPLTESGRYGRGAAASYQAGDLSVRGYVAKDRFTQSALVAPPAADDPQSLDAAKQRLPGTPVAEQALSMGYAYHDDAHVDLNFLRKQDADCPSGSDIQSLRHTARWAAGLTSELELGQSNCAGARGKALRGALSDQRFRLKYSLFVMRADADYRGSNADQQFAAFNAEYPLTAALSVRASHRTQQGNQRRDPARAALDETQDVVGAGYQFQGGARGDLEYVERNTADLRQAPDFDASHRAARLSLRQQYKRFSVFGSVELGTTTDHVRQNRFPARQLLASASWSASDRLSYGGYLFYVDNAYSTRKEAPQASAGATLHYLFSAKTVLDANLQASRGRTGSLGIDVRLSRQRDNGDVVALALRRASFGVTHTEMLLSYAVPLSIPLSKRDNVATVVGRVFDQQTGRGVPDLVLRLGGIVAVSGKNGEFSFPSVLIGTYYLSIDQIAGMSGKIPAQAMPMPVQVRRGADAGIEIPLVQSAILSGTVTVAEAQPVPAAAVGAQAGPTDRADTRNLLVLLRNGELVYKRLTDAGGRFYLGAIPPGHWTVSIDEEGIPAGYELEKMQFLVDLAPGQEVPVAFRLRPKIRAIKMQQQLMPVGS